MNYIYTFPMTDNSYLTEFYHQFSYNKDPEYESQYFKIVPASSNPSGLEITIYKDDNPFIKDSKTYPRSEIRGITQIKDGVNYTVNWEQYLENYPSGYWFSFFQIFAKNGPNIMLRWADDNFELLIIQDRNTIIPLKLNITEDIETWISWKIEFMLDTPNGYIKIYRNNIKLMETNGNLTGGDDSYLKFGIYSQEMQPTDTMLLFIKNLSLSTKPVDKP